MIHIERRGTGALEQALVFTGDSLGDALCVEQFVGPDLTIDTHAVAKYPELRQ